MAVAWLGMVVNTGCLYLFKGIWHIPIIPASIMAVEIAIIHNFILFRTWAWKDRPSDVPFFRQLIVYNAATGLVDLIGNVSILWLLSTYFNVYYLLANILGMIAPPFVKFWLNDKLIFRESRNDSAGRDSEVPN